MRLQSALLLAVATAVPVGCAGDERPDANAAGAPSSGAAGQEPGAGGATSAGSTSTGGASSGGAGAGGTTQSAGAGTLTGDGGTASGTGAAAGAQSSAGTATSGSGPTGGMSAGRGGSGPTGPGGRGGSETGGSAAGGKSGAAGSISAGTGPTGNAGAPSVPLTIYLAGDSTVSTYKDTASTTDQAGWGQMLGALFGAGVTVSNRAVGGSTARRFIDEGHFDDLFGDAGAGDWVFVQFGTNDGNKTATYEHDGETVPYYLDPATDFKTYLQRYIDAAAGKQAGIAFVTPPPRNSAYCTGGNGTGGHADAMRQLGADKSVPVLDLNKKSVDYLKAICPSPTPEDFFLLKSDGSVDGTHFQENGARILAGFVADEMRRVSLPLATLLK